MTAAGGWSRYHRFLWFVVPGLIVGSAWWYFSARILQGRAGLAVPTAANVITLAFIGFILLGTWLGISVLSGYLADERRVQWAIGLIVCLPLFAFFPFRWLTWLAYAVMAGGLAWAVARMAEEERDHVRVKPLTALSQALPLAVLGMSVTLSILHFQQERMVDQPVEARLHVVGDLVSITEKFLPGIYPPYRPDRTVDDFLGSQLPSADELLNEIDLAPGGERQVLLDQKLQALGLDPASISTNQSEQELRHELDRELERFRADALSQSRAELGSRLRVAVSGSETLHDLVTDVITQQISGPLQRFKAIIPPVLSLALFFALRLLAWLFSGVSVFFGWLWYRVLLLAHVIELVIKDVPARRVQWRP